MMAGIRDLLRPWWHLAQSPYWWMYFRWRGFPWKYNWIVRGKPILRCAKNAHVSIGERLTIVSKSRYNSVGVFQPVILTAFISGSEIAIGDDVGMSGCSITAMERIVIGDEVLIGSGVLIVDSDLHPIDPAGRRYSKKGVQTAPVVIRDNVFIGARAIILKGAEVGEGSVIGAGSVVSRSVPPYSVVAGNPARIVKRIDIACDGHELEEHGA